MSLEENCRKASTAADALYTEFTKKLAKQKTPADIYQLAAQTRTVLNDRSRSGKFAEINNTEKTLFFFNGLGTGALSAGAIGAATTAADVLLTGGMCTLVGLMVTGMPLAMYADNNTFSRSRFPKFIPLTQSQRLLFSTVQKLQKIDRILVKTMIAAQKADPQGIFALHQQLPSEHAAQTPAKLSRIFKGQLMKDFKAAKAAIVPPPIPDVLKPQPPSILAELDRKQP